MTIALQPVSQKIGKLTLQYTGKSLPLEVLRSQAGFYIGTAEDGWPVSRESVEYFRNEKRAQTALDTGEFTQRDRP